MKKLAVILCFYIVAILLVPYMIVRLLTVVPKTETASGRGEPIEAITTYAWATGEVSEINFGEYLKGVVAAEMPASFNEEALKAQAVAARSYILTRLQGYKRDGTPAEHNGAMTCDNPDHCKAWTPTDKLREQWGGDFDMYWNKISSCVEQTAGVVMTYDGALVNAVFHSTSSGSTESAKDVWGGDVPYLVSVQSQGDELSPKYSDSVTMSIEEYKNKILDEYPEAAWDGGELITNITRSSAGGIITLETGGVTIKATQFRTMFSLRSTNIEFSYDEDSITMSTKGNGHGVGMSQYGANYLASTGMGYEDILKTYYTGVDVGVFEGMI